MAVLVYFESSSHAQPAAVFPSEVEYDDCSHALHDAATSAQMIVTENIEADDVEVIEHICVDPVPAAIALLKKQEVVPARAWVVGYGYDCDGTPNNHLSAHATFKEALERANDLSLSGDGEEYLATADYPYVVEVAKAKGVDIEYAYK